ncbi:MAG: hypothetical protein ACOH18_03635 [Candidatus Saccharimonadaceae bacterium]
MIEGEGLQFETAEITYVQVEANRNGEFSTQLSRISVELYGLRYDLGVLETEPFEVSVLEYDGPISAVLLSSDESGIVSVEYTMPGGDAGAAVRHALVYDGSSLVYGREQEAPVPVVATLEGIEAAMFVCDVLQTARGDIREADS